MVQHVPLRMRIRRHGPSVSKRLSIWLLNKGSVSDQVLAVLVATLFQRTMSLIMGAVVVWFVAIAAFARTGSTWPLIWLAVDMATVAVRVGIIRAWQRGGGNPSLEEIEAPAFRLMAFGILWTAALGTGCFLCLLSGDSVLALLSSVVVTGVIGSLAFRNGGIPRYAMTQMLLLEVPLCLGMLTLPDFWAWLLALKSPAFVLGMSNIVHDHARQMTVTIEAEREAKALAVRLDAALLNMPNGLLMFERDGRLSVWNARAAEILGIDQCLPTRGVGLRPLLEAAGAEPGFLLDFEACLSRLAADGSEVRTLAIGARTLSFMCRKSADHVVTISVEDITERHESERRIAFLAEHDTVTGLGNRNRFNERLDACYAGEAGAPFCLALLDLDGFKEVNDTYGHPVGDQLLRAVAERLVAAVPADTVVVRLGGDEFALILHCDRAAALALAERLLACISRPYDIGPRHIATVGTSIGIAEGYADGETAASLLTHADTALYGAKAAGRGVARLYEPHLDLHRVRPAMRRAAMRSARPAPLAKAAAEG